MREALQNHLKGPLTLRELAGEEGFEPSIPRSRVRPTGVLQGARASVHARGVSVGGATGRYRTGADDSRGYTVATRPAEWWGLGPTRSGKPDARTGCASQDRE